VWLDVGVNTYKASGTKFHLASGTSEVWLPQSSSSASFRDGALGLRASFGSSGALGLRGGMSGMHVSGIELHLGILEGGERRPC
jgi:hypothetical protein